MIFFEEATYEGEWENDEMHGYGVFADNCGKHYDKIYLKYIVTVALR